MTYPRTIVIKYRTAQSIDYKSPSKRRFSLIRLIIVYNAYISILILIYCCDEKKIKKENKIKINKEICSTKSCSVCTKKKVSR